MSDNIRNRFRPSRLKDETRKSAKISWKSDNLIKPSKSTEKSKPDLFSIWDEQLAMEAEEKKMEQELEETKKKARELQKTLRKHQFGETKIKLTSKSKTVVSKSKNYTAKTKSWILSNKRKASAVGAFVIIPVVLIAFFTSSNNQTSTLGDSTSRIPITAELPREKPDFEILYPSNKSSEDFDTVRISPQEADASYTYLDQFSEQRSVFKVTQQEVPKNFDLEKVATEFQATNIIQIDDSKAYHGYSEKAKTQSLLFIKNDILISISSPEKFSDDEWANYLITLN